MWLAVGVMAVRTLAEVLAANHRRGAHIDEARVGCPLCPVYHLNSPSHRPPPAWRTWLRIAELGALAIAPWAAGLGVLVALGILHWP